TNKQATYTRNRIRHHILPYAEQEICRGTVVNMNRAADDLMMAEDYLRRETQKAAERCVCQDKERNEIRIDLNAFWQEDRYLRGRILLFCLEKVAGSRKDITATHVRSVERLFQSSGSKEIQLPYQITVYKQYDLGIIQKRCSALTVPEGQVCGNSLLLRSAAKENRGELKVDVPGSLKVPELGIVEFTVFPMDNSQNIPEKTYTKWFDYDKISSSMVFRTRQAGDYLTVKNNQGERKHKRLQDYFVNEKIPRQEREKILLLAEDSHVIWIPGYRISEYYKVDKNTCNILQVMVSDKEE
ncbi:MAG: tRNA lysidine(34) synthetase TilS, partial [Lachnospiraceae bacterium]|nr:tRNA lysidine(34) synthetase TilS [Lachnospiraceae bacterium]